MAYEVTIGIPVYNAAKYIYDTLLSALSQDYPSIEFLVLDDCGNDGSIDIVRKFQQEHSRGKDIRVVSNSTNLGIGKVRNRIIDEAKGKYLYFLDADDLMTPTAISLMVDVAEKNQAQLVMSSYEQIIEYGGIKEHKPCIYNSKVFTQPDALPSYSFHRYGALSANIWNVLMRMDVIRDNHLRFLDTNYWEDMAFKYDMVTYVDRAVLLPDVTYYYICRENSLSNFQERTSISKTEVGNNVATIDSLKRKWRVLMTKPYFADWLNIVLMTDFYIVCNILKNRNVIKPSFSNAELKAILYTPLSLSDTLCHADARGVLFWILGHIPSFLTIFIVKALYMLKRIL